MSRLCFGTYAKVIQNAMQEPNDNQAIAELLLGLLTDHEQVVDKQGEPINVIPKMVSLLFNFKQDVPKSIVSASSLPDVIQGANKYFSEKIVAFLNPHKRDDLLPKMTQLITNDSSISEDKKNALLSKAKADRLSEFLADTFLYAINRSNKQLTDSPDSETNDGLARAWKNIEELDDILSRIPRPTSIQRPDEPESQEMTYVSELLAAYADAEGLDELTKEDIPQYPKYKQDLERRRKDYYAAESVRRGSRDVFGEKDQDQFDALKNETYDGIIDVHSQDFPHGYARLTNVMTQAAAMPLNKCVLSRIPNWIGASEKKGVCHILVNDGLIKKWVNDDD